MADEEPNTANRTSVLDKLTSRQRKAMTVILWITVGVCIIVALRFIIYFSKKAGNESPQHIVVETFSIDIDHEESLSSPEERMVNLSSQSNETMIHGFSNLTIVKRFEWSAQATKLATKAALPFPLVVIIHTYTPECLNKLACEKEVRHIQKYHMNGRGFNDIAYNFLVGGEGTVFEGRGWDLVGSHTKGTNGIAFGIALIGYFGKTPAPQRQLNSTKELIKLGVSLNKLHENYKLYGHRQLSPGSAPSPGEMLFREIQTWPHFQF